VRANDTMPPVQRGATLRSKDPIYRSAPCAERAFASKPVVVTTYLGGGWYRAGAGGGLRTEVLDGAIDAAGLLHRAGVSAERVMVVALKVRAYLALIDPQMAGVGALNQRQRERLGEQLVIYTDSSTELQTFVADCVEHVAVPADAMAMYLHLMHVARMLKLLAHADLARGAMALLGSVPSSAPTPKTPKTNTRAKPKAKAKAKPAARLKAKSKATPKAKPTAKPKIKPKRSAKTSPRRRGAAGKPRPRKRS